MPYPKQFREDLIKNDYHAAVDLGLIAGISSDAKFGHCPDAGAVLTDVWERGLAQAIYIFPDAAGESIEIVSSDIGDTTSTKIQGLNFLGLFQEEEVTLNGQTPVSIPGTWIAINRAFNSNGTVFAGNISIRGDGVVSTNVFAVIAADDQQTSQAIYMAAANEVILIKNFSTAFNKGGGAAAFAIERLAIELPSGVFRTQIRYGLQKEGTSNISSDLIVGIPLPPMTKIKLSATPSGADSDISSEWSMHKYDTDWLGTPAVNKIKSFWGI